MSKDVRFQRSFPSSLVYSYCGMRKDKIGDKCWGKTKKRDANWCSPADGSINGFVDNLRKYCARQRKYRASVREIRKIRVERALLLSFVRNFFPSIRRREKMREKKRSEWKNREWVHFPRLDERELASTYSLLFSHRATVPLLPSPFTKSLAVLQSRCIAVSLN